MMMRRVGRLSLVCALLLTLVASGAAAHGPLQRGRAQVVSDPGVVLGRWIDTTVRIARGGLVNLELTSGEVIVTGWTRDDVRVRATADEGRGVSLRITSDLVSLRSNPVRGRDNGILYEVSVPATVRVMIRAGRGDVSAKGVGGDIEIRTGHGDVTVSDMGGLVIAELMSGDFVGARLGGGVRIDAVSADVQIMGAKGEIVVDNTSGETVLDGIASASVRAESVSGDVRYQGTIDPNGRYRMASHAGTITLRVPQGVGALLSLSTFSGEVNTQLPTTLEPGRRGAPEKHLTARLGDGSARIEIETFSGNIVILGPDRERED